ncbi:MAG TPA: hypothetical protein VGH89_34380 [Pseudonocardia sp.]|jgi:hypothetical protein
MTQALSWRDTSLLRAIAEDRCEIVCDPQPLLFVDGRVFCDTDAGRRLIEAGLLAKPGIGTGRWPARLTEAGTANLAIK